MSRARDMISEVLRGRDPRRVVEQEVGLASFVVDQQGDSLGDPWAKGDRVSWTGRPDAKPGTVEMVEGENVTVKWDDGTISSVLWGELIAIEKTEGLARLRHLKRETVSEDEREAAVQNVLTALKSGTQGGFFATVKQSLPDATFDELQDIIDDAKDRFTFGSESRKHEGFAPGDRVALTADSELEPNAKGTVVTVFDGGAEVRFDEPSALGVIAVQDGEISHIAEGRRRKREQDDLELKKRLADQYGTDVETVNDVLRKLLSSSETDARDLAVELGLMEDEADELVEDLKNSFGTESRKREQRFAGEVVRVEDIDALEQLLINHGGRSVATTGGPNFDPALVTMVIDFPSEDDARNFVADLKLELDVDPEQVGTARVWIPVESTVGDRFS